MICVPISLIQEKARTMPIDYWSECVACSTRSGEMLCFSLKNYTMLRRKYRRYAVSESDKFREGEIISGCCDRADQY